MEKSNKIDTNMLRKAASAVYTACPERVAKDISGKLTSAADEINFLRFERNMLRNDVDRIVDNLKRLTDEQRLDVFTNFCQHCGRKDPKCQCWNDE